MDAAQDDERDPSHSEKEHHTSALRYVLVWAGLLALTITTYFTAKLNLAPFDLAVAMLIAVAKSAMVVLFFMHLAEQKGANRMVFVVSVFFVALLMGLTLSDVGTRFPLANPPTGQTVRSPAYHPQTDADVQGPKPQPGSPSKELQY